ncbi:hypothetical protein [Falsirhodobacter deserti]|uniref:hypothetical protein n=1 Tax=Falsirhodobacter deserti TaxID=1365611 RepID=UPI0013E3BD35|nr:hypothetical protein [Falsirhodobacter deserti]
MKQVTSHFRTLAATDPTFGAAPQARDAKPTPEEADPSVDRLIKEADSQMNEPRAQRRQLAIRHLRDLVATRAAHRLDGTANTAPRRTRTEPAPGSTGFACLADRLGAETPPELVEAAAVFSVCMEHRATFTRPQILRHVASLGTITHEAMVEAFEELVAVAILEKQDRNRFALTSRSVFLREMRG